MKSKLMAWSQSLQEQIDGYKAMLLPSVEAPLVVRHILSVPFIYGMIVPFVFLHVCLEIYHQLCFRLYGIPLVNPNEYIIIDRHKMRSLTLMQKLQCIYCGYANGLIAYAQEIAGRTEKYWCPLKHRSEPKATHPHYKQFLEPTQEQLFEDYRNKMQNSFEQ